MQTNNASFAELSTVLQRFVRAANRGMASRYDTVRFDLLDIVKQRGSMRLSDLAGELDVNPSSVSRRVQELAETNMVALARNPEDGRSSLVALTEAGLAEWRRYVEGGVAATAHALRDWPESDVSALFRLLTRLIADWERAQVETNPPPPPTKPNGDQRR